MMRRREFVKIGLCGAASLATRRSFAAEPNSTPIIDGHIHLFDPTRPGGIPWPEKTDTVLYRPALPARYAGIAEPLGIVGAVAIEASPLASDNDWLLSVADKYPLIVGVVGDLIPATPTYVTDLDRLHKNSLFLGFRYGNLWKRNLGTDLQKPGFIEGLKTLSQAGLVFESANPHPELIDAILTVSDRVPELRIVIDHLPHALLPVELKARQEYETKLHRLAERPQIFVKLSEIPVRIDGKLVTDISFYQPTLDAIWDLFGSKRIFFGSDWPNSDTVASYSETLQIVRSYITRKAAEAQEDFFWRTSAAAYRWYKRAPTQPSA